MLFSRHAAEEESESKWYRVSVRSFHEDDVEVFFLDQGYSASIKTSSLRPLEEEFLILPAQAILCCLYNIQPITYEWLNDANACFSEMVSASELKCHVVEYANNSICQVELTNSSGVSIAEHLKKQGLAMEIEDTTEEQESTSPFITTLPPSTLSNTAGKIEVMISFLENPDEFFIHVS